MPGVDPVLAKRPRDKTANPVIRDCAEQHDRMPLLGDADRDVAGRATDVIDQFVRILDTGAVGHGVDIHPGPADDHDRASGKVVGDAF